LAFSAPSALSFPKSARLRKRPQFLAVKDQGRGFAEGPLAASWLGRPGFPAPAIGAPAIGGGRSAAGPSARVGIVVSAKVGNAVVRNRVKRRLREAIRQERARLPAVDLVIVARASATRATVPQLRAWLRKAAQRIEPAGVRAP
jgi:ribonuclease P protein component